MIGYKFPTSGAVALGMAPSGDARSYIVLAKYDRQYVTGRVYVDEFPAPADWDNDTYSDTIEAAVEYWIERSAISDEGDGVKWMSDLIRNTEACLAEREESTLLRA